MNKMAIARSMLCLLATLVLSCGGSSAARQFCERYDSCNSLSGETVNDCSERVQKQLNDLTTTRRSDCEKSIHACLDLNDCSNFRACGDALQC